MLPVKCIFHDLYIISVPICLRTSPFLTWWGLHEPPFLHSWCPFSSLPVWEPSLTWFEDTPFLTWFENPSYLYLIWGPFFSLLYLRTPPFLLDLWTSSISTCFKDPYLFFTPPLPTCLGAGNDLSSSITIFLASSKFFSLLSASSAWNYINNSFPDITLKKHLKDKQTATTYWMN